MSSPMKEAAERTLGIVVTTISDGEFLAAYAPSLRSPPPGHRARIYVVGDLNTPPACRQAALRFAAEGLDVRYLDVEAQAKLLAPFAELAAAIPFRSDARRNVGFLQALADRCEVVVSIDDDNFPTDRSFLAEHAAVGTEVELRCATSANHWFNIGCLLDSKDRSGAPVLIHPRGFPYSRRGADASGEAGPVERGRVDVNVGLWSGDPDVDAATRLVTGVAVRASSRPPVWLARGDRSPINTQNTAISWHAIVGYWFVTMGALLDGIAIGRYGDIFSGYFVQLCAEAVGGRVRVGAPWVDQIRNPHDLMKDLWCEVPAMRLVEEMVELFEQPLPAARSYLAAYRELSERIAGWAGTRHGNRWKDDVRGWLTTTARTMKLWCDACEVLAGGERALDC